MKRILLALTACAALAACDDPKAAKRALEIQGFTEITLTGWKWTGCAKGDDFTTGFTATAPSGMRVSGVVCSGWFKGATVRTW